MKRFTLLMLSLLCAAATFAQSEPLKLSAYNATTNWATWDGNNVSNIVDDSYNSKFWSDGGQDVGCYVAIEFEKAEIGHINLHFADGDRPVKASIDYSVDNAEWTTVSEFGTDDIVDGVYSCNAGGATAKYVRMIITEASTNWFQLKEFEVLRSNSWRVVSAGYDSAAGVVRINDEQVESVTSDNVVKLSAIANEGYIFVHWELNGEVASTAAEIVDATTGDKTYTAVFEAFTPVYYRLKNKSDDSYLTIVKKNQKAEGSLAGAAYGLANADQMFCMEPAGNGKVYLRSASGYYLNCSTWNVYAQNDARTTLVEVIETASAGYVGLYQSTSENPGFLNIQSNNNNQLYCDAAQAVAAGLWKFEEVTAAPALSTEKTYRLKSAPALGFSLQITDYTKTLGEGALQFKPVSYEESQFFQLEAVNAEENKYYLKNVKDGETYYLYVNEWNYYANKENKTELTIEHAAGLEAFTVYQETKSGYMGNAGESVADGTSVYSDQPADAKYITWYFEEVPYVAEIKELSTLVSDIDGVYGVDGVYGKEFGQYKSSYADFEARYAAVKAFCNNPGDDATAEDYNEKIAEAKLLKESLYVRENVEQGFCYTIVCKDATRGGMYAASGATMLDMCGVTNANAPAKDAHNVALDATSPAQQFAFVSYNGNLYLYNVGEKKFVCKNGNVNKLTAEAPFDYILVNKEEESGGYYYSLNFNGTNYITASPGWCSDASRNTCLQTTLTGKVPGNGWDDGAWYKITEAGEFDLNDALRILAGADESVSSHDQLERIEDNNMYVLQSWRAPLYYDAANGNRIWATTTGTDDSQTAIDASDVNQQFLLLRTENTAESKYYLYSVAAQKFVCGNNTLSADAPVAAVYMQGTNSVSGYGLELFITDNKKINTNGSGVVLTSDAGAGEDKGNCFRLVYAGECDSEILADAQNKVREYESARVAFDEAYAKAQEIINAAALTITEEKVTLTVTEGKAGYIWANSTATETQEGRDVSVGKLIDGIVGDASNYFHSGYSDEEKAKDYHYFEIDLGESNEIQQFFFDYTTRQNSVALANIPQTIEVYGSNDKSSYTSIRTFTGNNDGLPNANNSFYKSTAINADQPYRYIRFRMDGGSKFFHLAEFNLYKFNVTIDEQYSAFVNEVHVLQGLLTSHTNNSAYYAPALNEASEALNLAIRNCSPYSFTLKQLSSADLMEKTEPTQIVIKNISKNNNYWFAGTKNVDNFGKDAVLVWEPVTAGVKGSYYLRTLSGQYFKNTTNISLGSKSEATVFTSVNPTKSAGDSVDELYFDGDNEYNDNEGTLANINTADDANLVRFVTTNGTGSKIWINTAVTNGTPVYNNGNGGYTVHYVYEATTVEEFAVNITAAQYATFYAPVNVVLPDNAEAYIIDGIKNGEWLNLVPVTGVLPANTGVILYSETPVECTLAVTNDAATANVEGNKLQGRINDSYVAKDAAEEYYILSMDSNGNVGMYSPRLGDNNLKFKNYANKAYLVLANGTGNASTGFRFDFNGTTAIEEVESENGEVKAIYDLQGRRIDEITKPGIYVVNGNKVLVK